MAYFAFYDVWEEIAQIATSNTCTLTVYVDDVTISGEHVRARMMWDIKRAIHRSGLRYHKEKTFIDRPAEITGVIVYGDRLFNPKRQHKKMRDLKLAIKTDDASTSLRGKMQGVRGAMMQVERINQSKGT